MKQPPSNICPLFAIAGVGSVPAECIGDRCAWFDYGQNECVIFSIADNIKDAADKLEGAANGC